MIYQFRHGATYRGLDPQTTGDELERIRNANDGKLATSEVVRWAAEPDSPLHNAFTWDNERAAQKFRLGEARQLIRSVVVVKDADKPQPAYWNIAVVTPSNDDDVEDEIEHYYQSAAVIARNPHEFEAALKLMLKRMHSAQEGLQQLRQLAPKRDQITITTAVKHVESAQKALVDIQY